MICDKKSILIDGRNCLSLIQIFGPRKMSSSAFRKKKKKKYIKISQKWNVLFTAFTAHSAGCC